MRTTIKRRAGEPGIKGGQGSLGARGRRSRGAEELGAIAVEDATAFPGGLSHGGFGRHLIRQG